MRTRVVGDGIYVDANLLVLLVAGLTDRELIAKHRRLQTYTLDDYELLCVFVEDAGEVRVTPNTLTEASNLLEQHAEPERSALMSTLGALVKRSPERVIVSRDAAAHGKFVALGLTDAALLTVVSSDTPLVTVDLDLFVAALARGEGAAINFNHYR